MRKMKPFSSLMQGFKIIFCVVVVFFVLQINVGALMYPRTEQSSINTMDDNFLYPDSSIINHHFVRVTKIPVPDSFKYTGGSQTSTTWKKSDIGSSVEPLDYVRTDFHEYYMN